MAPLPQPRLFEMLRRGLAMAFALALAWPVAAVAECEHGASRIPMASPLPGGGPGFYRAHMLRAAAAPVVAPKPHAPRKAVHRVRRVTPHATPVVHRHRRLRPVRHYAAAAPAPTHAAPVPLPVAARHIAAAPFALIDTIVCESGPPPTPYLMSLRAPLAPEDVAQPVVEITPPPFPPAATDSGGPGLPPLPTGGFVSPTPPPTLPGVPVTPPVGPPVGPPVVGPPVVGPPVVGPPVVGPPDTPPGQPPVVGPPGQPPVGPPGQPPIGPPTGPPVTPPLTSVPEPGTWGLMIIGLGLAGAALRRRGAAAARGR